MNPCRHIDQTLSENYWKTKQNKSKKRVTKLASQLPHKLTQKLKWRQNVKNLLEADNAEETSY